MTDYGYIEWKRCPFCESDLDKNLLAHSANDCPALERE